jgi:hypothetical protein
MKSHIMKLSLALSEVQVKISGHNCGVIQVKIYVDTDHLMCDLWRKGL